MTVIDRLRTPPMAVGEGASMNNDALLRQLLSRLAYLDKKILLLSSSVKSDNVPATFGASGALDALTNERDWLAELIEHVGGVTP